MLKKIISTVLVASFLITTMVAYATITITPSDGNVIYDGGGYRYGPSIIINDDKSIDAWFASPGMNTGTYLYNNSDTNHSPAQLSGATTFGQKFHTDVEITTIGVNCPTWSTTNSSVEFKLYKWDTDYATTVATTPISDTVAANVVDNSAVSINLNGSALPAGDYLWVAKRVSGTIGIWEHSDNISGVTNFYNGKTTSGAKAYGDFETQINYNKSWDIIRYKHSDDGGKTWGPESIAIQPTPNSEDAFSCCDPGVFKLGDYYYLGYTSTMNDQGVDNSVYIARSKSQTGPFEKWNGSDWGGLPSAFIRFDGPAEQWGAGEPSFVVKDGTIYIYYTWQSADSNGNTTLETRVNTASASDPDWPAHMTYKGVAVSKDPNNAMDSCDVKYIEDYNKFIAVCTAQRMSDSSYIAAYESDDGITFTPSNMVNNASIQKGCHNIGISGRADGHIKLSDSNFIAYAYGSTWGDWPTYLNPITFSTDTPPSSSSQTAVSSSQPAASSSQPAVSSSQPAASSSQPAVSSSQPAVSSSQPAVSSSQPVASSSQSATVSSQPTDVSSQPGLDTNTVSQPVTDQSATDNVPNTGDDALPILSVIALSAASLAVIILNKKKN